MLPRDRLVLEFWNRKDELSVKNKEYRNFVKGILSFLFKNDLKKGDITSSHINNRIRTVIISKENGIIAGLEELALINQGLKLKFFKKDGDRIKNKEVIVEIIGNANKILPMERTNLNLLQRMSGIATLTSDLSKKSGNLRVAATRKTPWGLMDKKAVIIGGGLSHRLSLNDGIIIKDNHLKLLKYDFGKIIYIYKSTSKRVEIEVENKEHALKAAMAIKSALAKNNKNIFALMLDKIKPKDIRYIARELKKSGVYGSILLEASGNINGKNIKNYAHCGADIISMGCLTNSPKAIDLSQEIR